MIEKAIIDLLLFTLKAIVLVILIPAGVSILFIRFMTNVRNFNNNTEEFSDAEKDQEKWN